jgi:hypothetical protein
VNDDDACNTQMGSDRPAPREPVRRPATSPLGPAAASFRWQRLRSAIAAGLRNARIELVDVGAGGRGRGELLSHLAIATHGHLTGQLEQVDTTGEGERMKRSTKRLLIGVAAGIAVYHFAIAPRKA